MSNKYVKNILLTTEGKHCLLTGYRFKKNKCTYHHIIKQEWGGLAIPENGACLDHRIHEWLHCAIELNDKELFMLINECLLCYKEALAKDNQELIWLFRDECQPLFRDKIKRKR